MARKRFSMTHKCGHYILSVTKTFDLTTPNMGSESVPLSNMYEKTIQCLKN
jgi:Zn-dependent peptidase ImmA (M78 family)